MLRPLFSISFLLCSLAQSILAGPPAGYSLQWSDEFNGNSLNTGNWNYTDNGWRNSAYNTSNAVAVTNGCLVITTYTQNGTNFTGFIDSSGKVTNSYGYYEASIQFSNAPGNWSAFWIQGPFVGNTNNNPTNGAEIDIFEHRQTDSSNNNWVNGGDHAIHWDGYVSGIEQSASYSSENLGVGNGFHTYGLLWTSNNYIFSIDNHPTWTNNSFVSSAPEFIRLTSEVESNSWAGTVPGGGYPALTNSPFQMDVDYVRYYAPPVSGGNPSFYVSPTGSGNNFSLAQPGNLFDVRNYIRTISTNMTGDIVVYLLGGTYQLTNSFQLQENSTNHDSGTGGYNIIYENYPGETPIISGGMLVTNWSLSDPTKNIWSTYVGTGVNSRQLYVNGIRAIRARSALNPSGFVTNTAGTGFWTTNTAMQNWGNATNIEIVQRHNWKQLRCVIQSITGTNIVMQTPGWTYEAPTPTPGRPWNGNGVVSLTGVSWVENAYELLASPGMWYLNEATGYLYYIPRPGENLTNGTVVVLPTVEKLVDAQGGDYTTPIHNIIFSGIAFEYATWLLPSTGSGYADNQTSVMWSGPTNALKTMGNISFQTAANIQITNCVFEHLGGSAIDFGTGAHSNSVFGNYIDDISADGISVGEVDDYATTNEDQETDGNTIQDNFIRRPGQEYEDCIGIFVIFSKNTTIAHNDVDNTPYSGICLGWGWGTATYSQNNMVLGNYVGKVMQTLTDGGSVYSLSAQTNSWHIGNYYKDSCYQGIYWDEGSQGWTAISNVFDNCVHNYINLNSSSTSTTGGITNNQNNIATNNFSNVTAASNPATKGVNDVITNTTFSKLQFWPLAAQQIILQAGLEPAFAQLKPAEFLVNDSEPYFDLVPSDWTYSSARDYDEYHNDVHYTQIDGQTVQYTFTASAISWIGEMNTDESNVNVYLDGNFQQTVNCYSATRVAQARLFSVTNLPAGPHTLQLVKNGGTYMIVDAFAVTPNNFWLTATTNAATINAGNTFSNMVKFDVFGNYSGTTTLSVSGLPANCSAIFSSPTLTGAGFSTMTITTMSNTPSGNYELAITGIGGGVTNIAMIGFVVIGSSNERWNSTSSGAWDTTTTNWFNLTTSLPDIFQTGDNVFFDDTSGVTTNVTIAGGVTVQPNTVTISSSVNNFTIGGAGIIGGTASIVKSGLSILNLNTTNNFSGNVTVSGGILRAGNGSALGSNGGSTTITNGGTLDVNGNNLTAEPIIVSGNGVGANGAIINNGTNQISALRQVTLAGNVTFGGTNRWDIRNTGGTASLSTGGQPYNITKVGTNQISLVAVNPIDSAFANINIQQGEFAIQTSTTQVGDPTKTIFVWSNATLEVWALTTPLNKQIVLSNGATIYNENSSSFISGPVMLNGNDTFNIAGISLTLSNVISGAGNLIKSGATNLVFAGTNIYTGSTTLTKGEIFLVANGSISGSAIISIATNTILDASGRTDKTLTLNSGQTLTGGGTVNGNLTVGAGATILPLPNGANLVGSLTITNLLALQGATILRVDKLHGTNDLLISASVNFGGTLIVSNLNNAFANGDSFKLFNAGNYSGNFSALQPPSPGAGLAWNTTGLTNGVLKVATVTQSPRIGNISISGANVIVSGTNGTRGGAYYLLASTNVALPLANWPVIATNLFNGNSSFTFTNMANPYLPQTFYLLRLP